MDWNCRLILLCCRAIFDSEDIPLHEKRELEKKLLHAIIQGEESERNRFAKDLHDGLSPIQSTVKMSLTTVTRRPHDETSNTILLNADSAIDEVINSIREISNNLSPHILALHVSR